MKRAALQRSATVLHVTRRTMIPMRTFFVDKLGFEVGTEVNSAGNKRPQFVTLDRDGQTLMLSCRLFSWPAKDWASYFWVDDIDALQRELISRETPLKGGVTDKPYGCREPVAVAPDGREIVFGQLT